MTSIRTAVYCLALPAIVLFSMPSFGQKSPGLHRIIPPKPVPISRWVLTFNPFGLLEPPAAAGLGIGYRLNRTIELWSETSLLVPGLWLNKDTVSGFRQLLQVRCFIHYAPNTFIGVEARYKSVWIWELNDLYNPATQNVLLNWDNHTHKYFFGMALLAGQRFTFGRSGRLQLEMTVGLGFKNACVAFKNIPPGYVERSAHKAKMDTPFGSRVIGDFSGPYIPCTMRVVYLLGKRFRPL